MSDISNQKGKNFAFEKFNQREFLREAYIDWLYGKGKVRINNLNESKSNFKQLNMESASLMINR